MRRVIQTTMFDAPRPAGHMHQCQTCQSLWPCTVAHCQLGAMPQRFQGREILLIPIVVRVGLEVQEHLWESWLNVHQGEPEGGLVYLQDLARQDRLTLHWYGDHRTRERSLVVSNQLRAFAQQAMSEAEQYQPWPMLAFDRARAQLEQRYPSVLALWQALGQAQR